MVSSLRPPRLVRANKGFGMENIWLASALWVGLALIAAVMQQWVAVSVALLEIVTGAVAGNLVDLTLTPWVNYLAGFGAILLTFLAGAEIDARVIRRNFGSTIAIGIIGFLAPYLGVLAYAHFISGWSWPQAQIAGIALSTTSVAVVYAVWSKPVSTRPRSARSSWRPASSTTC